MYSSLFFSFFALNWALISAYPRGAPRGFCPGFLPQHNGGRVQRDRPSPYTLTVNGATYGPGADHLNVTLSGGPSKETFKGFFIQAILNNIPLDHPERQAYGTFTNTSGHAKPNWCENWFRSVGGATHTMNDDKTEVTVVWNSPPFDAGELQFVATAVRNYFQYWVDIRSTPITPRFPAQMPPTGGRPNGGRPGGVGGRPGGFLPPGQSNNPWLGMLMNGFRPGGRMGPF